jgi:hypothetical protein
VEEAAYVLEGRPPGGWDTLVTKEYLDLRLDALKHELKSELRTHFHAETTRLVRWFVPTFFGGVAALGGITGAVMGFVVALTG